MGDKSMYSRCEEEHRQQRKEYQKILCEPLPPQTKEKDPDQNGDEDYN